ncbi:MAG: OmpA family protein [Bacteroidales bacterium]|nr:OmpA family protein [Bacteroidales bacterium]
MTFFGCMLFGQAIKVDTSFSADYLVEKMLAGKGIRVGNVRMTGQKHSICYFEMDTNVIGMKTGLMLSTGNIYDIAKENTLPGTSGTAWDYTKNKRYKSDRDLNSLCRGITYDQMILEFDFVPFDNKIIFNFAFASEEYTEYVGSKFNDVFAFMITGDGLKKKNLAVIPGTNEPITINNINQKNHSELFIDNDYFFNYSVFKSGSYISKFIGFKPVLNKLFNSSHRSKGFYCVEAERRKLNQVIVSNLGFDGLTRVLHASCIVKPWKLYHLKIALGDVGDAIFDSGVFLEENSFISEKDTTVKNFSEYPDLYATIDFDSIFGLKKVQLSDTIPAIEEQFKITDINFDTDKYIIPDTSKIELDMLATYLLSHKSFNITINGHTDNQGSRDYNIELSENRALAVMDYLATKGIDKTRLITQGYSFDIPVADNTLVKGRARNRRVEIKIHSK